jgi:energy-coupling factor transport system ATP-binding protein
MLELKNLTFLYETSMGPVIDDISLNVKEGECVLLAGASGSGKSTLLHCINGLNPHFYGGTRFGSIKLNGKEMSSLGLAEISQFMGTVFQNPSTQFFLTGVEEEIVLGLEYRGLEKGEIEKRINSAKESLGIKDIMERNIFNLSSGEKQRCAIASVAVLNQPLILFDEPTANLDPGGIAAVKNMLVKLKNEGRTIIISEHRLHFLKELADRIVILKEGKIFYDGSTDILENDDFRAKEGLRCWSIDKSCSFPDDEVKNDGFLSVESLSLVKSKKEIIKDVSFGVSKGNILGVVGENGAGKTTIARSLCGLESKLKGRVAIDGTVMTPGKIDRRTAFVFQQPDQQLFADTVTEELLFGKNGAGMSSDEVEELLTSFDLKKLEKRHPHSLSGGEKQRVAIATGLSLKPQILILDEPTSGMDGYRLNMLAEKIKDLSKKGVTVIIITHDHELINLCCNSIVEVKKGKVSRCWKKKWQSGEHHE